MEKGLFARISVLIMLSFCLMACSQKTEVRRTEAPLVQGGNSTSLSNTKYPQTLAKKGRDLFDFAHLVNVAIVTSPKFLEQIQSEANKQFDGDFDVLVPVSFRRTNKEMRSNAGSLYTSLIETLSSQMRAENGQLYEKDSIDKLLDRLYREHPLLNIYMPDWTNEDIKDDFLIVVLPDTFEDGMDMPLPALNLKGELVYVSSLKEPSVPYMVIGSNERVILSDNAKVSVDKKTFYGDFNAYEVDSFIPCENESDMNKSASLRAMTSGKRSLLDKKSDEVITMARFMSKQALQNVEGWHHGKPEVKMRAYYKSLSSVVDFFVGEISHHEVNMGIEGWYTGHRLWISGGKWDVCPNYGNWHIMRWIPVAHPTKMKYVFFETDHKSHTITVNVGSNDISFTYSKGTDEIGSTWVLFTDPLGKTYTLSNAFQFTLNQE